MRRSGVRLFSPAPGIRAKAGKDAGLFPFTVVRSRVRAARSASADAARFAAAAGAAARAGGRLRGLRRGALAAAGAAAARTGGAAAAGRIDGVHGIPFRWRRTRQVREKGFSGGDAPLA